MDWKKAVCRVCGSKRDVHERGCYFFEYSDRTYVLDKETGKLVRPYRGRIEIDLSTINPESFQLRRGLESSLKTFVKKNVNVYKTKEEKKEKETNTSLFNGPINQNKKLPQEEELDVSGLLED